MRKAFSIRLDGINISLNYLHINGICPLVRYEAVWGYKVSVKITEESVRSVEFVSKKGFSGEVNPGLEFHMKSGRNIPATHVVLSKGDIMTREG